VTQGDATDQESLRQRIAEDAPALRADLTGPIRIEATSSTASGGQVCRGTGTVFVPVERDPDGIGVALPVRLTATLDADGRVTSLNIDEPSPAELTQAAAYGRSILATGAVRGHPSARVRRGMGSRPTHEIQTDSNGRRVLVRIGFA
jgi:hypothetical protein